MAGSTWRAGPGRRPNRPRRQIVSSRATNLPEVVWRTRPTLATLAGQPDRGLTPRSQLFRTESSVPVLIPPTSQQESMNPCERPGTPATGDDVSPGLARCDRALLETSGSSFVGANRSYFVRGLTYRHLLSPCSCWRGLGKPAGCDASRRGRGDPRNTNGVRAWERGGWT